MFLTRNLIMNNFETKTVEKKSTKLRNIFGWFTRTTTAYRKKTNLKNYTRPPKRTPGMRFSKVPKTFRFRKLLYAHNVYYHWTDFWQFWKVKCWKNLQCYWTGWVILFYVVMLLRYITLACHVTSRHAMLCYFGIGNGFQKFILGP